jgi:hypothetical protein
VSSGASLNNETSCCWLVLAAVLLTWSSSATNQNETVGEVPFLTELFLTILKGEFVYEKLTPT